MQMPLLKTFRILQTGLGKVQKLTAVNGENMQQIHVSLVFLKPCAKENKAGKNYWIKDTQLGYSENKEQ